MDEVEALVEARKRWGRGAMARIGPNTHWCCVGPALKVYGTGLSWEQAFADADRKQEERQERRTKEWERAFADADRKQGGL